MIINARVKTAARRRRAGALLFVLPLLAGLLGGIWLDWRFLATGVTVALLGPLLLPLLAPSWGPATTASVTVDTPTTRTSVADAERQV